MHLGFIVLVWSWRALHCDICNCTYQIIPQFSCNGYNKFHQWWIFWEVPLYLVNSCRKWCYIDTLFIVASNYMSAWEIRLLTLIDTIYVIVCIINFTSSAVTAQRWKLTALLYRFLAILFIFVDLQPNSSFWSYHSEGCMLQYVSSESRVYRIAGIFRGYKCAWFSRMKHVPRTFIAAAKRMLFHENYERHFRENLYPQNIPAIRYM